MKVSIRWVAVSALMFSLTTGAQPATEMQARIVAAPGVVNAVYAVGHHAPGWRAKGQAGLDAVFVPGRYIISFTCASPARRQVPAAAVATQDAGRHTVELNAGHLYRAFCPDRADGVLRIVESRAPKVSVQAPRLVVTQLPALQRNHVGDGAHALGGRLPPYFANVRLVDQSPLKDSPAAIAQRIRKSRCGSASADMSALALHGGLSTRPSTSEELKVDEGSFADGTHWLALKRRGDDSFAYCGVVLSPTSGGSTVSLLGIPGNRELKAISAVESGKFFCKCKSLRG
jgi:hypothetical protein